jgi:hypothetical protein
MDRARSMHGKTQNTYRVLVGKPEGKSPSKKLRSRWEYNIKMDLKRDRMGWYGMD